MVERGSSTPTLDLDEGLATSPVISVEEVACPSKRQKVVRKGKEKVGASVWSDAETTMDRANELLTLGEMKEITSVPSHEMVSHHVHKLMQVILHVFVLFFVLNCSTVFIDFGGTFCRQVLGEAMHIATQYLANEEKAVVANSKVEALEAEASDLRKDLITTMDSLNASKEQVQALMEQLDAEKQSVK